MGKTIFICKLCREKYSSLDGLYSHLECEHGDAIPEDMCVEQFYYFLKTGKEHGKCVECGKPTLWNDKTKKYKRFCEDPECMEKYKETVRNRMIGKYGKVNLLNDPEQQRKMLMNRKISGLYDFNGVKIPYVGSYELDFLKTMDLFLDWDPTDIIMPSPHNYYYMYNGEKKFYIPDVFIPSLGLEIEIKDGGNNPNMHHKIQDVDKEKERLKDEVMSTQKIHHYIKITNKNYYNLFDFFDKMKEGLEKYGDYDKIPKIIITEDIKTKQVNPKSKSLLKKEANEVLKENLEPVEESYVINKKDLYINFDKFESGKSNICLITGLSGSGKSTLGKKIASEHNAIYVELDAFEHLKYTSTSQIRKSLVFDEYFKNNKDVYNKLINGIEMSDLHKELFKFMKWLIPHCEKDKTHKYVIEGVEIYSHGDPKQVKGKPIIFVNTSVSKSIVQKYKRDYKGFTKKELLDDLKNDLPEIIKWYLGEHKCLNEFKKEITKENYENVEESYLFSKDDLYINFDKFESGESNICLITGLSGSGKSSLGKSLANKYNAIYVELDAFYMLNNGLESIHPIFKNFFKKHKNIYDQMPNFDLNNDSSISAYILNSIMEYCKSLKNKKFIIEGVQFFIYDIDDVKDLPLIIKNTSVIKSMSRMLKRDNVNEDGKFIYKDIFKIVPKYLKYYNDDERNLKKFKNEVLKENYENVEESFNPDKALVWLDKPIDKLFNKKIKLYHGSIEDIKGNKIDPISINVGATKFSNPRWSTYFWDDIESAKQWAMTWIVQRTTHSNVLYRGHEGKSIIGNNTKYNDEEFIQSILKGNPYIYIYETEIPISKLEMGSVPSIREYTVSESVPITKKHKIKVTKKMIQDYIEIKDDSIVKQMVDECPIDHMKNVRGFILNNILNNERDTYRLMIINDIKNNKIKIGDDLSKYKNRINDAVKNDLYGLRESFNHYITLNINNNMSNGLYGFRDNVSSISFDNNHLKRVNHKLQQVEESCIDKENTTEIKIGYNGDIKPIINKNSNQGVFLIWNKKDSINTLLESISKEWFDSKLTIDDFHIIGGDNNVW